MKNYLKLLIFLSLAICFFVNKTIAQNEPPKDIESSIGIGGGLDYGGLGINYLMYPDNHLGAFLGLGYNILGLGYNAGLKYRFNKENHKPHTTSFYALAMFGYNAALKVTTYDPYSGNNSVFQKVYYGPSVGLGFERRRSQYKKGYWSFALLVPFRTSEYQKNIDDFKSKGISLNPIPLSISIGYRYFL